MSNDAEYIRTDLEQSESYGIDVRADTWTEQREWLQYRNDHDSRSAPTSSTGSWEHIGRGERRIDSPNASVAESYSTASAISTPVPLFVAGAGEAGDTCEEETRGYLDVLGLAHRYLGEFSLSPVDGELPRSEQSIGDTSAGSLSDTNSTCGSVDIANSDSARRTSSFARIRPLAGTSLASMLLKEVRIVLPRRRIIHEIYERRVHRAADGRIVEAGERYRSGAFVVFATHGDHWHIVHDCSYSAGTCRCALVAEVSNTLRRFKRRIFRSGEFAVEHYANLLEYLETDERRIEYVQVGRRSWRHDCTTRKIFEQFGRTNRPAKLVARGGVSLYTSDTEESQDSALGETTRKRNRELLRGTSRVLEAGDEFARWVRGFAVSPLSYIFQLRAFAESKWRYTSRSNAIFVTALHNYATELNGYSTLELFKIVNKMDPQFIVYNAPHGDVNEYYYDVNTSLEIMRTLLLFQYGGDAAEVKRFVHRLADIVDKRIPKRNTMLIVSPPNAGKSFFLTPLCTIS